MATGHSESADCCFVRESTPEPYPPSPCGFKHLSPEGVWVGLTPGSQPHSSIRGLGVVVGGSYSIKEEICFEMKTLLFLICLGLLSPASLVCMNSAPISRRPLSIFSMRMGLEQAPSPCPPLVLSKDKLLTSVKAFLINRRIRHGMSSGVQRVLIKEGGGPGHTSLPVGSFIRSVQHLSS